MLTTSPLPLYHEYHADHGLYRSKRWLPFVQETSDKGMSTVPRHEHYLGTTADSEQCDGGRPQCQRCIIYKAECPGYRRESEIKFISENNAGGEPKSLPVRKRPPKSRPATRSPSLTSESAQHSDSSSSSSPSPALVHRSSPGLVLQNGAGVTVLPMQVPTMWDEYSLSAFIHDWTIPDTGNVLAIGALEFVRALQPECAPDVEFSLALKAASLASFANQHNAPEMLARARSTYGQALSALNSSLRDPVTATQDRVLAAIVLLHIYESVTADASPTVGQHDAGLRMLLEMRGDEQFDTSRGRSLARFVLGYLHARNVNERRGHTTIMLRGFRRLGYPPEHPAMANSEELRAVTALLAELTPLFDMNPEDPKLREKAISILQSVHECDHAFARWMSRLPPTWRKTDFQVARDPLLDGETTIPSSGVVYLYTTPLIPCYIALYRIQYMVMHKVVLRMANYLGIDDWSIPASFGRQSVLLDRRRSLNILHRHNTDTLASAAYAMGEVDQQGNRRQHSGGRAVGAFYLLWPLTHIALDVNSTPDQVADALQALSYMGNILGVRRGLRNAIQTMPSGGFGWTGSPPQQQIEHKPSQRLSPSAAS